MNIDYTNLKNLAKAATQGEWASSSAVPDLSPERVFQVDGALIARPIRLSDTRFIAAANPAQVLALIAEIEELRGFSSRGVLSGVEVKQAAMRDLVTLIETADAKDKTIAEAIYDAGYRKFEIVEEDV